MFLGVDGGGSKTEFVLINEQGRQCASHSLSGTYHVQIGMDRLRQILDEGIDEVCAKVGIGRTDIRAAFFGLPAYGEDSRVIAELDSIPKTLLPKVVTACGNDMVCAWAGSLGGADGVNIIAGTGSIGYGQYGDRAARSGGWGELFSDEGSAYWIGSRGLTLFSRMCDGRTAPGPLQAILRKALQLETDLDLSGRIMSDYAGERDKIARLAGYVHAAAQAGDIEAQALYAEAADELADIILAIVHELQVPEGVLFPVSYSGGVFRAGALVLDPLKDRLEATNYALELTQPWASPAVGAAICAAHLVDERSLPELMC